MKIKVPTLETERLILRMWKKKDAPQLYEYAKNPNVGPHAGWKPHESVHESRMIISQLFLTNMCWAIVDKETGKVIGEIFAHIGKPKKAQDNKIANDILKMLLLEKISGRKYRKIIAVCDEDEKKKLQGTSALSESIRQFGIEILYIPIDETLRNQLLRAQERQKMTNV